MGTGSHVKIQINEKHKADYLGLLWVSSWAPADEARIFLPGGITEEI